MQQVWQSNSYLSGVAVGAMVAQKKVACRDSFRKRKIMNTRGIAGWSDRLAIDY